MIEKKFVGKTNVPIDKIGNLTKSRKTQIFDPIWAPVA